MRILMLFTVAPKKEKSIPSLQTIQITSIKVSIINNNKLVLLIFIIVTFYLLMTSIPAFCFTINISCQQIKSLVNLKITYLHYSRKFAGRRRGNFGD